MGTNAMALIQNMLNSGQHDSSTKAVFLCTAVKLQCCHMLATWTQQTQPPPTIIQHSFEQEVQLFHQVLSFENCHWAGLGQISAAACATTEKRWCPVSTFSYFRGKAFLGKPTSSRLVENTHGSKLDCRLYNNFLTPALVGACAMEMNTMALMQTR